MTDKHDKLVEMALDAGFHAGKTISGQRYAYDGAGIDVTKELAAFASAHVASLCADVKPWVWLVTGSRVFDDQVEFTQSKAEARIAERKDGSECVPLVPASVVASLTAQRDAALARVAELEKDAARWRFSMWYQQEHLKNPSLRCEAIDELYRSRVELSADNYTAAIDKAITSTPDYDAALTKGQP